MKLPHRLVPTLLLLSAADIAWAQSGAEVAGFYWLVIGGSGVLLLGLLAWLVFVLRKSHGSEETKAFHSSKATGSNEGRLGE